MASSVLWPGNCSFSWRSCHSFRMASASVEFTPRCLLRRDFHLKNRSRRLSVRACAVTAGEELELEQLSDEGGAIGMIAISPQTDFPAASCESSEQNNTGDNLIECNGINRRTSSETISVDSKTNDQLAYKSYEDSELLSRCTSVAERSAIALATMAYERAKRLFNVVAMNLTDLENNFRKRSKAFGLPLASHSGTEPEDSEVEFRELHNRVFRLEQELNDNDQKLQLALMEVKNAYDKLTQLHNAPPKVIHDVDLIVDDSADEIGSVGSRANETDARSRQEFLLVEEKVAGLLEKVRHRNGLVSGWKNAFAVLQLESQHSFEALQNSVQELVNAQMHIQSLKTLTENQTAEITAKNEQLSALEEQLSITRRELENVSKSLSVADQQRSGFEEHIKHLEEALRHEKETIAAVIRSSSSQKDALAVSDKKVVSLTSEVASLESLVEGKEELILAMRDDARRNANMLVSAAKTREALLIAEKRIEQLSSQVNALEEEVKSRDLVLNDIKEEAVQSTEALRLAAQIKQDLNLSRKRELELTQELDRMKDAVKDLRQEIVENNRAVRAEHALRQLESELDEVTAEVDILRKGVEARDGAIQLMKEEVDRNIDVLSHAAGNRELVRELEEHIEELKGELRKKDTMLAAMGKGLDGPSLYKNSAGSSSSCLYNNSSNYSLPSSSTSGSSQSFPNESMRKRVNRNNNGGYKRSFDV